MPIADGYTTDELILKWKPVKEPVEVNKNIKMPKFKLQGVSSVVCDANFNTTGKLRPSFITCISYNETCLQGTPQYP